MNRGRRQVTLTRESRGETACSFRYCSGNIHYSFDSERKQASADKSNHIRRPPNPFFDSLVFAASTAPIDHGLYSLSLLDPASPLRFCSVYFCPPTARKLKSPIALAIDHQTFNRCSMLPNNRNCLICCNHKLLSFPQPMCRANLL